MIFFLSSRRAFVFELTKWKNEKIFLLLIAYQIFQSSSAIKSRLSRFTSRFPTMLTASVWWWENSSRQIKKFFFLFIEGTKIDNNVREKLWKNFPTFVEFRATQLPLLLLSRLYEQCQIEIFHDTMTQANRNKI